MRKNLTKKICVLMTAAMLATGVTACGNKTDATSATTTEATTAESKAEETTAAEETTTEAATTEAEKETEKAADGALTEEEYLAKAEELSQKVVDTMTKAQQDLAALDPNDAEGAKKLIEDMKAPFIEFTEVVAPEKYAEAQAKYKSGCESLIEYLDICVEMIELGASGETPTAEQTQDLTQRMTDAITAAQTDLLEGDNLMNQ